MSTFLNKLLTAFALIAFTAVLVWTAQYDVRQKTSILVPPITVMQLAQADDDEPSCQDTDDDGECDDNGSRD